MHKYDRMGKGGNCIKPEVKGTSSLLLDGEQDPTCGDWPIFNEELILRVLFATVICKMGVSNDVEKFYCNTIALFSVL